MALSPLLTLPAEIRNRIYEFALINIDPLATAPQSNIIHASSSAIQPGLTRSCRQVRNETLKMFYTCNTFLLYCDLPHTAKSTRWVASIAGHMPMISRFSLCMNNTYDAITDGIVTTTFNLLEQERRMTMSAKFIRAGENVRNWAGQDERLLYKLDKSTDYLTSSETSVTPRAISRLMEEWYRVLLSHRDLLDCVRCGSTYLRHIGRRRPSNRCVPCRRS